MRGLLLIAVALALAVVALTATWRREVRAGAPPESTSEALRRCRELGEAAASDAACRAEWRAARARFLGRAP